MWYSTQWTHTALLSLHITGPVISLVYTVLIDCYSLCYVPSTLFVSVPTNIVDLYNSKKTAVEWIESFQEAITKDTEKL